MMPGRGLVLFAALSGFAVGTILVLAGLWAAIWIPASSDALADGAEGLSEGIAGAESTVRVLGQDFEESSSLLGSVSSSIRQTSLIAGDTRASLGHARDAASELVTACDLTAGDLESISSRLGAVIGPTRLAEAGGHLRSAAAAGAQTVESMDSLAVRLEGLESMLAAVAASVDTLGSDLAATRCAMEDAGTRLASVRLLTERSSSRAFVASAGIVAGLALVILGLEQLILSTLLLGLRRPRGPSTFPSQEADPGRG